MSLFFGLVGAFMPSVAPIEGKKDKKLDRLFFGRHRSRRSKKKERMGRVDCPLRARPVRNKQERSDCTAPKKGRVALCARAFPLPPPHDYLKKATLANLWQDSNGC